MLDLFLAPFRRYRKLMGGEWVLIETNTGRYYWKRAKLVKEYEKVFVRYTETY